MAQKNPGAVFQTSQENGLEGDGHAVYGGLAKWGYGGCVGSVITEHLLRTGCVCWTLGLWLPQTLPWIPSKKEPLASRSHPTPAGGASVGRISSGRDQAARTQHSLFLG